MRRLEYLIAFALLAAGLCGLWPEGTASAKDLPVIFATSAGGEGGIGGEAKLYFIDPETGEATEIGDTGFYRISALDFDDNGVLYGIGEDGDQDSVLITIDLKTGEGTLVGETGIEEDVGIAAAVPGCSFDESDGTLYAWAEDGVLYTVDLDDGTATEAGTDESAASGGGNALGFDSGGNLYRCDYEELYSVDTSDGTNTYEDDLTVDNLDDDNDFLYAVRGMDWWDDSSLFYAVIIIDDASEGVDVYHLGTIDPTDATVELIDLTENLGAIAVADVSVLGAAPEITAGPTPTPTKVSFASGSVDFSVTASDDDGDTLTYSWDFGDGGTATGASPTHVYAASGEFDVTVTVSDGLLEDTGAVKVTVNHPATIDTGPSADPLTVSPTVGEIDFSATASDLDGDPLTYNWDFGDTESDSGADVSHTYAAEGAYTVTLTVNDGFDDTVATVDVLVNTPPEIDSGPEATPNPVSLASSTIDFSVTASDVNGHDLTYDWDFGDGGSDTGSSVSHTYSGSGDYTATVTVDDGFDPVQATVDVRVNTPPTIDTGPGASPTLVEIGETVTFGAAASDVNGDTVTFSWDFGDTSSTSGEPVTHSFGSDGVFTVTLTVSDGLDDVTGTVDVTVAKSIGIAKFKGKLNFKKQNKDGFLLKGDVELPQDFTPGGKSFQVDVGGATATFTMDEKGKAKTDTGKLKLKLNKKKGLWSFKLKLKKSSFADKWEDEGLVNRDVAGVEVKLRTTLTVDGIMFIKTTTLTYSGKSGKTGKVK